MKKILLTAIITAFLFPAIAMPASLHEIQQKWGTDKIAHFGMGATCSFALTDRVFTKETKHWWNPFSKTFRKFKALSICTFLAFQKEKSDTKSDVKDFTWTVAGAAIPLITWRW